MNYVLIIFTLLITTGNGNQGRKQYSPNYVYKDFGSRAACEKAKDRSLALARSFRQPRERDQPITTVDQVVKAECVPYQ